MTYKIKKTIAGAYLIKFNCTSCDTPLSESLDRAGEQDQCPQCGTKFVLPGTREKAAYEADLRDKKLIAEQRKLQDQQEKETQRQERDRQRQEAIDAKRYEEVEAQRQFEQERIRLANVAEQKRLALLGSTFEQDSHDWSTGGPYVYECQELNTVSTSHGWSQCIKEIINKQAQHGWEFFRSEDFTVREPPGCLGGLFGFSHTTYLMKVLVFRRPANVVKKQQSVAHTLSP